MNSVYHANTPTYGKEIQTFIVQHLIDIIALTKMRTTIEMKERMNDDRLLWALRYAAYYNGIDDILKEWLKLEPNDNKIITETYYNDPDLSEHEKGEIQIFWMICVLMFGDYGISPRLGWIEDVDGFRQFIKEITRKEQ